MENSRFISYFNDLLLKYLVKKGHPTTSRNFPGVVNNAAMITTDCAMTIKAEIFWEEELIFQVGVHDFNKYGFDFYFKVLRVEDLSTVALAKIGVVFMDINIRKPMLLPSHILAIFNDNIRDCLDEK